MIGGMDWRNSGQRGIHTNIPLISGEGPENDPSLNWFGDSIISLLDSLKGNIFSNDFSCYIQKSIWWLFILTNTISIFTYTTRTEQKRATAIKTTNNAAIFLRVITVYRSDAGTTQPLRWRHRSRLTRSWNGGALTHWDCAVWTYRMRKILYD